MNCHGSTKITNDRTKSFSSFLVNRCSFDSIDDVHVLDMVLCNRDRYRTKSRTHMLNAVKNKSEYSVNFFVLDDQMNVISAYCQY
jgi:hypothetical protein